MNQILREHGFRFKKKWGQNFISDRNILDRIVQAAEIQPGDGVIEIGPGAGTLTRALAEAGAQVVALEIDQTLLPILEEFLSGLDVKVIEADVLKSDLAKIAAEQSLKRPYKIVANLPYYITTPIIMKILESDLDFERLVIMVQWEVAKRLTAQAGSKDYGAITLAIQYYTEGKILFKVPRQVFNPAPEVDSAVISLCKREQPPVDVADLQLMFKLIKAAFGQRRKTVLNALSSGGLGLEREQIAQRLELAGIDPKRRGETLTIDEFARLENIWLK
ncbi:MAG: 16S rRNA (adenine(1518)-N(6)/adenine(1519)-N(6))-dimethyltransferase RsmA [Peptococcia bacterium]